MFTSLTDALAHNREAQNPVLDLGKLGLTGNEPELEQLKEFVWVETLSFSDRWYDWEKKAWIESENKREYNCLTYLPDYLPVSLQKLVASEQRIEDFSFLSGLTSLTYLYLRNNHIEDISFLAGLTNLISLNLNCNEIYDISVLSDLTNLQIIDLGESNIHDISFLAGLTDLTNLCLYGNEIYDISFLAGLTGLTSLDLSHNQIQDFSFLSSLMSLTSLDLSHNQILDTSFLSSLTSLTSLDLSHNQIQDFSFLSSLTSLTSLDLSGNQIHNISFLADLTGLIDLCIYDNEIHDISVLSGLTGLTSLDISYNQIYDISFLSGLTRLTSLNISGNHIYDISFLAGLTDLTILKLHSNQIQEISFLAGLSGLSTLLLSFNQIQDISFLANLTSLTFLDLRDNQIQDISFLASLTSLTNLDLSNNQIRDFSFAFLRNFPQLEMLCLNKNPIQNLPPEIFDEWDCLEPVRRYFADLQAGKVRVYQSKVVVVGNGRVGKTCLLKRWLDNTHNPDEPSTHAITTRAHFLPELAGKMGLDYVQLNVWDFGGQDIYHSTHRLFMQTKAVFLVVWDWETEQTDTQTEVLPTGEKVTYQNLSLLDWLDYVQTLGKGSPAIVVQTKTALHKKRVPPSQNTIEAKGYPVAQYVSVDSALDTEPQNGFDDLRFQLSRVLQEQIKGACVDLPASWWRVQVAIQDLQSKGEKMLSLPAFEDLCQKAGLPTESVGTVQSYLHDTGAFFFQWRLFHNQIILDQQWAISAVYTLFDRQGLFQRLQRNGFFKGQDLIDVWKDKYSPEAQELFVSFMVSCRICMEIREEGEWRRERREFAQREYIAPQLLPDTDVPNVGKLYRQGEGYWVALSHPFLHESVMQEFILRTADYALRDNLRKHQILVEADGGEAWVQALPKEKKLLIRIKTEADKPILDKIRNTLADISKDIIGITETVSIDGVGFVPIADLLAPSQSTYLKANNGQEYEREKFVIFIPKSKEVFGVHKFEKEKIYKMIEGLYFSEVFDMLDELGDLGENMTTLNALRRECIGGNQSAEFANRLKMFVKFLKMT